MIAERDGSAPQLDVGVVYTHERQYVGPLLTTLRESAAGVPLRLILVDNVSEEGVDQWASLAPKTLVLANDERLPYAPNLNRILAASSAPYVLLLNTDMYFDPAEQCLAKMVRFMQSQPQCGVAGCRLYHPDGEYGHPARRFQSLRTIAARRGGMSRVFADELQDYLYEREDRHASFECDWLSGCFLLVRREAYEQVGEFDAGFAKYFEDVDYCLRMALAGWRVMFHGGTFAYHYEQRASKRLFSIDAVRHMNSYVRWLAKWGFSPQRRIAAQDRRAA
jgi:N-acetylglucosaminyl-diphospho-decaprenol L-rhamnosyltransferase